MKTLTVKLSPELDAKLNREAQRRKTHKSKILREALEAYLTNGSKQPSCLDLAWDLAGSVDSGITDLATNPKYMEGYGR